jgi:perosamine synthetase
VHELAFNYRMPDVLAALGTSQMRRLPQFIARRRELVARYCRDLAGIDGLVLPMERPDVRAAWHLFAVRVLDGRRRELYDRLLQAGIRTQVHYLPVHLQPVFQDLGFRAGMCPVAEAAYTELLSLPLHPSLTDEEQQRVVSVVRDVL